VVSFPELAPSEHEVAAQECDAIADYLDKTAEIFSDNAQVATQLRLAAMAVRSRAERHRA
jgi:hypothetical protein